MHAYDRRQMLALVGGAAALPLLAGGRAAAAGPADTFTMWHDPGCGCCLEWAKRIEAAFGRRLSMVPAQDMAAVKRARGVPDDLRSCHTALIQGYSIEGHVPPADIRRLIASGNRRIRGLAVPGMPMGAPGMENGGHADPFRVIAFGPAGRSVFARHG